MMASTTRQHQQRYIHQEIHRGNRHHWGGGGTTPARMIQTIRKSKKKGGTPEIYTVTDKLARRSMKAYYYKYFKSMSLDTTNCSMLK